MDAERFEYLMNELYFGLCLAQRRLGMFIWRTIDWIFYPLKYIFKRFIFSKKKLQEIDDNQKMMNPIMAGIADGISEGGAWQSIYQIAMSVPWFFCWILLGIIMWTFGDKAFRFVFMPFASLYIVYAYVQWAIDKDNKSDKYLKKFKKRSAAWQKKMERVGIIAAIIALILFIAGPLIGLKLSDSWIIGYFIEKG